jgi:hypothetical protein
MTDSRLRRLLDTLADLPVFMSLWVLDRIAGPMPKTLADEIRERRRTRLRKAFPGLLPVERPKKRQRRVKRSP